MSVLSIVADWPSGSATKSRLADDMAGRWGARVHGDVVMQMENFESENRLEKVKVRANGALGMEVSGKRAAAGRLRFPGLLACDMK